MELSTADPGVRCDHDDIEARLAAAVGLRHVNRAGNIEARFVTNYMFDYSAQPDFLVRPATTEEVAAIVGIANDFGLVITVVSGNSGLVGGTNCAGGILLSLDRMSRILEIDPLGMSVTVEAGAVLETVQEAVDAAGMLFPVDLNSRGSCTIGGMASTNAGGNRVVRYGMMRSSVLGLEAVLPDGSVVSRLGANLKDNAGYDWTQLLIGSEGTLGILTQVVMRLYPRPRSSRTAILAIPADIDPIVAFRGLEARLGAQLVSFELMWPAYYALACERLLGEGPHPLPPGDGVYAIAEVLGSNPEHDEVLFEGALTQMLEDGMLADAVLDKSEADRRTFWSLREDGLNVFRDLTPVVALDVSVPVSSVVRFVAEVEAMLAESYSETPAYFFGHAGDGNIHIIMCRCDPADPRSSRLETAVYASVSRFGGSIAAEHGIGRIKRGSLHFSRTPAEIAFMQRIKSAIDPDGIFNRGVVLPDA